MITWLRVWLLEGAFMCFPAPRRPRRRADEEKQTHHSDRWETLYEDAGRFDMRQSIPPRQPYGRPSAHLFLHAEEVIAVTSGGGNPRGEEIHEATVRSRRLLCAREMWTFHFFFAPHVPHEITVFITLHSRISSAFQASITAIDNHCHQNICYSTPVGLIWTNSSGK